LGPKSTSFVSTVPAVRPGAVWYFRYWQGYSRQFDSTEIVETVLMLLVVGTIVALIRALVVGKLVGTLAAVPAVHFFVALMGGLAVHLYMLVGMRMRD